MKLVLKVIQNHHSHSVPTVVLISERRKYIFNLPELMQRFFPEHFINYSKTSHLFFTQIKTSHIAGLIGFLITLPEYNAASDVKLYGPPGYLSLLHGSRSFVGNRILSYSGYEFLTKKKLLGISSDEMLNKILATPDYEYIFSDLEEFLSRNKMRSKHDVNDAEKYIVDHGRYEDEDLIVIPVVVDKDVKSGKSVVCYVCKTKNIRGKVLEEKLKELPIPRKLIKDLLREGSLEINGQKYSAEQITEPERAAKVFVIVDCPTFSCVENLIQAPEITSLFEENINPQKEELAMIVHSVSPDIAKSELYKQWIAKFSPSTHHIFINEHITEIETMTPKFNGKYRKEFRHFAYVQLMKHYFPQFFPEMSPERSTEAIMLNKILPEISNKSIPAYLVDYMLAPSKSQGFKSALPEYSSQSQTIDLKDHPPLKEAHKTILQEIEAAKSNPANLSALNLFKGCDPELVFLGTASTVPLSYRNVSCIYLRFVDQNDVGIMLDCGEGADYQMKNHFGVKKSKELLKKLRVIFITHKHGDHHLGIMQLLSERNKVTEQEGNGGSKEPVYLVIPLNMAAWIHHYEKEIENLNCKIVFSQHINSKAESTEKSILWRLESLSSIEGYENSGFENQRGVDHLQKMQSDSWKNLLEMKAMLQNEFGITQFMSVDVVHCQQAQGIVIGHKNGWKMVYSGDTRPAPKLVRDAPDTTILIHEATFSHDAANQARSKKHSTDKEAIFQGMKMKAWRTILTHFSVKYGRQLKITGLGQSKDEDPAFLDYANNNTVVAFDHLRMRFSDLAYMPPVTKFLSGMIPEDNKQ